MTKKRTAPVSYMDRSHVKAIRAAVGGNPKALFGQRYRNSDYLSVLLRFAKGEKGRVRQTRLAVACLIEDHPAWGDPDAQRAAVYASLERQIAILIEKATKPRSGLYPKMLFKKGEDITVFSRMDERDRLAEGWKKTPQEAERS